MVLLRGAGKDFCVGRQAPPPPRPRRRPWNGGASPISCSTLWNDPQFADPVVCVVQGRALGFGCAVAAVADITIASDTATFQVRKCCTTSCRPW